MTTRTRTATDTRYQLVSRQEALTIATLTLDTAKAHGMQLRPTGAIADADVWHLARIEYTDADEVYLAVHIWRSADGVYHGSAYPQPAALSPRYELSAADLRGAAAAMAEILAGHGAYMVHATRTHTTDLVSY